MTEWMDRDDKPVEKKYFEPTGETIETPGMVRWVNHSHYFLKRIGTRNMVTKPNTFVLGLETRFGDNAYSYISGIEFDNDEAPDLMDRIAGFNGLPTYTELLATVNRVKTVAAYLDRSGLPGDYEAINMLHDALEGKDPNA